MKERNCGGDIDFHRFRWIGICNDIIIQMKKQIVNIDFKEDQGLILNWNYSDIFRKTHYFRHIVIMDTTEIETASSILQNYIKCIKPGDLFTTIFKSQYQMLKIKQWREKTYNHHFSIRNYINSQKLQLFNIPQVLQFIQNSLYQINEPLILNFILQKQSQIIQLQKYVKIYQNQGKMKFINTVFSSLRDNSLSVCQPLNFISTADPDTLIFYHHHINQVAIQYAHLTITCRNGQLGSSSQLDWKNTGFNKIERYYYAPTIKYGKDVVHIINTKIIHTGSYQLDINLQYKCFNGVVYNSQKNIIINFNHSEFYNRTVAIPKRKRFFLTSSNIELQGDPYNSETVVAFQKDVLAKDLQEI